MTQTQPAIPAALRSPVAARRMLDRLEARREETQRLRDAREAQRRDRAEYLAVADQITAALESLSEQLFAELVQTLQTQLTRALQNVLDQPLELKVERGNQRGSATLGFYIERAGKREDIMKGQGGSVVNVLSVGLRLLALRGQDPRRHRPFLILDEQDCWLRPDLVPKLVAIIRDAGRTMGFQILMISHHDPAMFEKYADRIYRCRPHSDGQETYLLVEESPTARSDASDGN